MEKVFYNLISNSFKFVSSNGEIKVSLNIIDDAVEIRIKDTGIGIPSDRLPHIFDRFYQVDSSASRKHEGTGIGLALTKELIELHKGIISVNSKEGEGSEFIILLPKGDYKTETEAFVNKHSELSLQVKNYNESGSAATKPKPVVSPTDADKREVILIVEDNFDVRSYVSGLLVNDYRVIEAADGEEGISNAKDEIPDLIITDVMMPGMDGFQFSTEDKKRCKDESYSNYNADRESRTR